MDFYQELIDWIISNKPNLEELAKKKLQIASKLHLKKIPSNFDILLHVQKRQLSKLRPYIMTKPTRTLSGVTVVAIMTKPRACPHGKCAICPGGPKSVFGNTPQSYTGREPAAMRAERNHFDAFLQVFNRLEQYTVLGHPTEKVELIIMGGTFPSYPIKYQDNFVRDAFLAMNTFSKMFLKGGLLQIDKFREFFELPGEIANNDRVKRVQKKILALKKDTTIAIEQKRNENTSVRCVAMCIETRPDYCKDKHIKQMLKLGCTRVEIGVQSINNEFLNTIKRGHDVEESIDATLKLKKAFLKVGYHLMIGLPGSTSKEDINMFKTVFSDDRFKPDFIKIYPCMVMKGTELYDSYKAGLYKPISIKRAVFIILQAKKAFPEYTRVMRVQRDIPEVHISAGPKLSNLRQEIQKHNPECKCIRCREFGTKTKQGVKVDLDNKEFKVLMYDASEATEFFIQAQEPKTDTLLGFCRLRLGEEAGIRELHVYGVSAKFGEKGSVQHRGIGKQLMEIAEKIAKEFKYPSIKVISGIGVRNYYRKLGYIKIGPYLRKKFK